MEESINNSFTDLSETMITKHLSHLEPSRDSTFHDIQIENVQQLCMLWQFLEDGEWINFDDDINILLNIYEAKYLSHRDQDS